MTLHLYSKKDSPASQSQKNSLAEPLNTQHSLMSTRQNLPTTTSVNHVAHATFLSSNQCNQTNVPSSTDTKTPMLPVANPENRIRGLMLACQIKMP